MKKESRSPSQTDMKNFLLNTSSATLEFVIAECKGEIHMLKDRLNVPEFAERYKKLTKQIEEIQIILDERD